MGTLVFVYSVISGDETVGSTQLGVRTRVGLGDSCDNPSSCRYRAW